MSNLKPCLSPAFFFRLAPSASEPSSSTIDVRPSHLLDLFFLSRGFSAPCQAPPGLVGCNTVVGCPDFSTFLICVRFAWRFASSRFRPFRIFFFPRSPVGNASNGGLTLSLRWGKTHFACLPFFLVFLCVARFFSTATAFLLSCNLFFKTYLSWNQPPRAHVLGPLLAFFGRSPRVPLSYFPPTKMALRLVGLWSPLLPPFTTLERLAFSPPFFFFLWAFLRKR